jgi:hypothetical protein
LAHTVGVTGTTETAGRDKVITESGVDEIQPSAFVPETEYSVLLVGVNATVGPCAVVLHVYERAPDAVKLVVAIEQTVTKEGVIAITGRLIVVIATVAVEAHPAVLVPTTVKVASAGGAVVMVEPGVVPSQT